MPVPIAGPSSSAHSDLGTSNGTLDISQIKSNAQHHVDTLLTRRPRPDPSALVKSAQSQMTLARSADARGDLPGALGAFTKAAALLQGAISGMMAPGVDAGVKRKGEEAVRAFMDGEEGREMERWKRDVERRLGAMISAQQQQRAKEESVSTASGGSIAERKRALAGAGLAVDNNNSSKRALPSVPTSLPGSSSPQSPTHASPTSPTQPTFASHRTTPSLNIPPSFGSAMSSASASAGLPPPIGATPNGFVPKEALAPSPSTPSYEDYRSFERSTPTGVVPPHSSSSTAADGMDMLSSPSEFKHNFPSLSEFEHREFAESPTSASANILQPSISSSYTNTNNGIFPPTPTYNSNTFSPASTSTNVFPNNAYPTSPLSNSFSPPPPQIERKDTLVERGLSKFPAIPPDFSPIPQPRPASTPVTPLQDHFASRPASPTKRSPIPLSKPIGLDVKGSRESIHAHDHQHQHSGGNSPLATGSGSGSSPPPLPKGAVDPLELRRLLSRGANVLLLDVRSRKAFDGARVSHGAVVCVDPALLLPEAAGNSASEVAPGLGESLGGAGKDGRSVEEICDAIEASLPAHEQTLWANRDKFELVVSLDQSSTLSATHPGGQSCVPPHLARLAEVVWERAFRRATRRAPVVLVGGVEGWARAGGEVAGKDVDALLNLVASSGSSPASTGSGVGGVTAGMAGLGLGSGGESGRKEGRPLTLAENQARMRMSVEGAKSPAVNYATHPGHAATNGYQPQPSNGYQTQPASSSTNSNGYQPPAPTTSNAYQPTPTISSNPFPAPLPAYNTSSGSYARDVYASAPPSAYTTPSGGSPQHTGDSNGGHGHRLVRKATYSRLRDGGMGHMRGADSVSSLASPPMSPTFSNGPIAYPSLSRPTLGNQSSFSGGNGAVSPPPVASINASPLAGARRRSEAVDPAPVRAPAPIDYPHLDLRAPPPAAATRSSGHAYSPSLPSLPSSALPSQSPHHAANGHAVMKGPPEAPMLPQLHSVGYWDSSEIGMSGLKNMGNTCYMNSTVQCLSATAPFAAFFRDGSWMKAVNHVNPLGSKGQVAHAFSKLVRELWGMSSSFLTPTDFRRAITALASQFAGSEQHDSQEFLSFLMDGLHEDLNRVLHRPTVDRSPEEEAALEHLPPQIASHKEWAVYRMRNDSIVVDWFQGQFRNRLTCLTCSTTSTTYNAFMYLTLPVPSKMMGKLTLSQCLDAFVAEEVLEKSDAWFCPHCKQKRKARKQLTLSRLPPVLLIHLKRFSAKTHFTDKVDKLVDFPLRGLDLSSYVPSAVPQSSFSPPTGLPPEDRSDPRAQVPPFKYDLYAVTNHFGSLSSGHYTAFVKSGQDWRYCDDSRISRAEEKDVVGKPAYVLYYKRVRA